MALQIYQVVSPQSIFVLCKPKQRLPQILKQHRRQQLSMQCVSKTEVSQPDSRMVYQPTIWSDDFIKLLDASIPINYERVNELEQKVRSLLNADSENGILSVLQVLEHIDDIERLGLGYRFQNDIIRALSTIADINIVKIGEKEDSVYAASLKFRLLRKHGYNVSQDFVRRFKDSRGDFMEFLKTDLKGLINLYEASYLAFEGERDLHEAKLFATEYLHNYKGREYGAHELINHALELPLYRRMLKLEARWHIDAYGKRKDANILMLELAALDFNMVQSQLKTELQELSKWWKNIGLASKLSFVRDRLMECFYWTVGMVFEPQYNSCRIGLTKFGALITVIDDIYDVYGSLNELKIFTDAVKRWDITAIEHMPEYLQVGYRALYNTVTELSFNTPTALPILAKEWGGLLEAFYVEAKWTHNKYIPTLEDYLNNAWRSVSGVVILSHGYFLFNKEMKKDTIESLEKYHELLKWSSTIFRLCNDLGTSSDEIKQGKTANAISCYMHENGVCEEVAREYTKKLIDEAWRKMIKAKFACSQVSGDPFIEMAINLARLSHCTYQYGDGHGAPDARAKDRVVSVIIEPVTI